MKRKFIYEAKKVCASQIQIELEDNIIESVKFTGGCNGNAQGISRLVVGMKIEDVIDKLEGIQCKNKETSCPDQLSKALLSIKNSIVTKT